MDGLIRHAVLAPNSILDMDKIIIHDDKAAFVQECIDKRAQQAVPVVTWTVRTIREVIREMIREMIREAKTKILRKNER